MHIPSALAQARATLEYYLTTVVTPHLWESGYRTGPVGKSTALKVWLPRNAQGQLTLEDTPLETGVLVDTFMGFTDTGVITDVEGGGLVSVDFKSLPVEDLQALDSWMAEARDSGIFPGKLSASAA